MMAWELSEKYDAEFAAWREQNQAKHKVEVSRFREVRPARDPRNESAIMGAFVIGCLLWIPLVIWALVTK